MAVRNFWIEPTVDGRKTPIAFGPRAKDGGFELKIYQRAKGEAVGILTICGQAQADNVLRLAVERQEEFMDKFLL